MRFLLSCCISVWAITPLQADDYVVNRCEILPLPNHQTSLTIDGMEKLRWHFGHQSPGPFFYPFNGPSGVSLTRMGHPGAENHDHHRSVWFAHYKVNGIDFWSNKSKSTIRQKHWYRYRDGDDEAVLACCLGWFDEEGTEVMEQDAVAALRPLPNGEHELELQLVLRPAKGADTVSLDQTNFGLLAVRVAKSLSAHFGGGAITNSEGQTGESKIFGQQARWMDYSGPVVTGTGTNRQVIYEGITYFDHPANPGYPAHWHVRSDGWMGASPGMHTAYQITSGDEMVLRYLLHAHSGKYDEQKAVVAHERFKARSLFRIFKPDRSVPHLQYDVARETGNN